MFRGGDDQNGSTTQPALYYPAQPGYQQPQQRPAGSSAYPALPPLNEGGLQRGSHPQAGQSGRPYYPGAAYPVPGQPSPSGRPAPQAHHQATAPPVATASNTSSVTTYAVRIKQEYRISQGVPEVSLRPTEDTSVNIDLSLEDEINRAELQAASERSQHHGADANINLLGGMDGAPAPDSPIRIPTTDAADYKLQQLSARAVSAAHEDEEILRLALIKCSERDEHGIIAFCEGLQQVLDVTAGRADKYEAAMKLIAGQDPADLIQSHSF